MMILHNTSDKYCPSGHSWIKVEFSVYYTDYYYCHECDEVYVIRAVKATKLPKNLNPIPDIDIDNMKRQGKIWRAKQMITYQDIIKLGYYKEKSE